MTDEQFEQAYDKFFIKEIREYYHNKEYKATLKSFLRFYISESNKKFYCNRETKGKETCVGQCLICYNIEEYD